MRFKPIAILLLTIFLYYSAPGSGFFRVSAQNKYGIHILETPEVETAARLVNSSGGDWGYVTIVLREDKLDGSEWQHFFNECRRLHIIPIIRLGTKMVPEGYWQKPSLDDLQKIPDFLANLNWPVKEQIVVIFNEPNHSQEWGGEINPAEYSQVLDQMIDLFKAKNPNFVVLPAGFDQAASNTASTMAEEDFLEQMALAVPDIFNKIDGWASHSYPNHGYIGQPGDTGRATIKGYEWELSVLKSLGLNKDLPVFITETGWPHYQGVEKQWGYYDEETVAKFTKLGFEVWHNDTRVKAATPFVLNYAYPPFDHFSWEKADGSFYQQFEEVKAATKASWFPAQVESFVITKLDIFDFLPVDYTVRGKVSLKNTGQWIMGERGEVEIEATWSANLTSSGIKLLKTDLLFPLRTKELDFVVKTSTQAGEAHLKIGDLEKTIYIFKPWELRSTRVSLWQQLKTKIKLWWLEFRGTV